MIGHPRSFGRIFNFNPEPLRKAAETYLACGVTELEVPQMVLDPDDRYPDTGLDIDAVRQTRRLLPPATRGGVVRGALEIDVPRQHPLLEVLCAALYLTSVHGVRTTQQLSYQELVGRVFPARAGG